MKIRLSFAVLSAGILMVALIFAFPQQPVAADKAGAPLLNSTATARGKLQSTKTPVAVATKTPRPTLSPTRAPVPPFSWLAATSGFGLWGWGGVLLLLIVVVLVSWRRSANGPEDKK
jgi:hypothetical protein